MPNRIQPQPIMGQNVEDHDPAGPDRPRDQKHFNNEGLLRRAVAGQNQRRGVAQAMDVQMQDVAEIAAPNNPQGPHAGVLVPPQWRRVEGAGQAERLIFGRALIPEQAFPIVRPPEPPEVGRDPIFGEAFARAQLLEEPRVGGDLNLEIPEGLRVGGELILRGRYHLVEIPEDLRVNGNPFLEAAPPFWGGADDFVAERGAGGEFNSSIPLNAAELGPLATAPFPYPQIRALNLELPKILHKSIAKQLRFFATMEGSAQNFSVSSAFRPDGTLDGNSYHDASDYSGSDMKSFVRDVLQERPPGLTILTLNNAKTQIVVHGDHNPNIGKALHYISGEFRDTLAILYKRDTDRSDHKSLSGLFEAIGGWCLDGSINKLNQYVQENSLSEDDLTLVPNLDKKYTDELKACEFLRVFRLSQARLFEKATREPAEDSEGYLKLAFKKEYYHAALFDKFLSTHESASMLTDKERQKFQQSVRDIGLIDELELPPGQKT